MVISDTGKLGALVLVIVGLFALVLSGRVDFGDIAPFLTLVIGYLVGNGAAAVRSKAPTSVLMSTVHQDEVVTIHGPYPAERTNGEEIEPGIGASDS